MSEWKGHPDVCRVVDGIQAEGHWVTIEQPRERLTSLNAKAEGYAMGLFTTTEVGSVLGGIEWQVFVVPRVDATVQSIVAALYHEWGHIHTITENEVARTSHGLVDIEELLRIEAKAWRWAKAHCHMPWCDLMRETARMAYRSYVEIYEEEREPWTIRETNKTLNCLPTPR